MFSANTAAQRTFIKAEDVEMPKIVGDQIWLHISDAEAFAWATCVEFRPESNGTIPRPIQKHICFAKKTFQVLKTTIFWSEDYTSSRQPVNSRLISTVACSQSHRGLAAWAKPQDKP